MKTQLLLAACVAIAIAAIAPTSAALAADDVLIADFEGTDYGNWKVEGEAFGSGPAAGTLGGQMQVTGFEGKGARQFVPGRRSPQRPAHLARVHHRSGTTSSSSSAAAGTRARPA